MIYLFLLYCAFTYYANRKLCQIVLNPDNHLYSSSIKLSIADRVIWAVLYILSPITLAVETIMWLLIIIITSIFH